MEKNYECIYIRIMENDTFATKRGEAKVKKRSSSYYRYKKIEKAINEASDNGRCWWIKRYLQNTIKY